MSKSLVVDTHALIWIVNGDETCGKLARAAVADACKTDFLLVPAISLWEVAMLEKKGRISLSISLKGWIDRLLSMPFIKIVPLSPEIALESCALPDGFHGDPADKMIVATSRILNIPLLTRDQKIMAYANESYLKVIPC